MPNHRNNLKWIHKIWSLNQTFKWFKVFKNGPSKICGRQPLKNLKWPYQFKFFKGCLPQVLLGPFLNTLTQMKLLRFLNFILRITGISSRSPIIKTSCIPLWQSKCFGPFSFNLTSHSFLLSNKVKMDIEILKTYQATWHSKFFASKFCYSKAKNWRITCMF